MKFVSYLLQFEAADGFRLKIRTDFCAICEKSTGFSEWFGAVVSSGCDTTIPSLSLSSDFDPVSNGLGLDRIDVELFGRRGFAGDKMR